MLPSQLCSSLEDSKRHPLWCAQTTCPPHGPPSVPTRPWGRGFLDGFGVPYSLVTGNHDLEADEYETDAENLEAWKRACLLGPCGPCPWTSAWTALGRGARFDLREHLLWGLSGTLSRTRRSIKKIQTSPPPPFKCWGTHSIGPDPRGCDTY